MYPIHTWMHFDGCFLYGLLSGFYIQSNAHHFHTVIHLDVVDFSVDSFFFYRKSHLIEYWICYVLLSERVKISKLIFFVNDFGINDFSSLVAKWSGRKRVTMRWEPHKLLHSKSRIFAALQVKNDDSMSKWNESLISFYWNWKDSRNGRF